MMFLVFSPHIREHNRCDKVRSSRIRIVSKSACYLRHVHPSVRLSAGINKTPTYGFK